MPKLIRLYILSILIGFVLSALFVALLLWLDLAGLGRLIAGSGMGWVAVIMLWIFHGIVFSGVQFGLRIMMMADPDNGPRGGLRQRLHGALIPAMAKVRVRTRG